MAAKFARSGTSGNAAFSRTRARTKSMEIAKDKVDEAILALLWLNQHVTGVAWKGFDWATMNRLHERGLISDPARRRKSVWFTEEGDAAAEKAFRSLFSSGNDETSGSETTP